MDAVPKEFLVHESALPPTMRYFDGEDPHSDLAGIEGAKGIRLQRRQRASGIETTLAFERERGVNAPFVGRYGQRWVHVLARRKSPANYCTINCTIPDGSERTRGIISEFADELRTGRQSENMSFRPIRACPGLLNRRPSIETFCASADLPYTYSLR